MADALEEKWLRQAGLGVAVFAALASAAALKVSAANTQAQLYSTMENSRWSFYQAKSVKEFVVRGNKDLFEAERMTASDPQVQAFLDRKIKEYGVNADQYVAQKDKVLLEAEKIMADQDSVKRQGGSFGASLLLFLTAILVASSAAAFRIKPFWFAGLLVAAAGLVFFVNGSLLLF